MRSNRSPGTNALLLGAVLGVLLALLVSGCYNAAPWCTKAMPCHTTPKDSTKTDTTHKGEG